MIRTQDRDLDARLRDLVRVDQPLVLISQAQRSGGTLLLRLLDGHPECHVAPFQLRGIDEAAKHPPSDPQAGWRALYDPKLAQRYRSGHRQRKGDVLRDDETFAFELPPELQRAVYDASASRLAEPTSRDLFDAYFTSYFNAWLDYRGLRSGEKRWLVGFEPGVAQSLRRRNAIRTLYPDGRVVSVVRDPWSWWASARSWEPRWRDREAALDHWCRIARGTLKWRKRAPQAVLLLSFEDLLLQTEQTVRALAGWLGIAFTPSLLEPTFNGMPIRANTSFADVGTEVSSRPLERARGKLDEDDVAYIDLRARLLYERLLGVARAP